MFNAQKPSLDELSSSAQLLRSTVIAATSAVTVVLPAEYGIDPTGVGGAIGLAEMGEIKTELSEEAEADRLLEAGEEQSNLLNDVFGLFVSSAHAQEADAWREETTFTLAPGDTAEWKLLMEEGQTAHPSMRLDDSLGRSRLRTHAATAQAPSERW